jgi:hypothetical protein
VHVRAPYELRPYFTPAGHHINFIGLNCYHFFKFWKRTHDRLFFVFGCSFWLLAVTRIGLVVTNSEESHAWYGLRLVAFLLILYAIWDKNRPMARRD